MLLIRIFPMSLLRKIRAFAESKVKRDALGRFASENSDDIARATRIVTGIAASSLPGGAVTGKAVKVATNLVVKKLTKQSTSVKQEMANVGAELTGKEIGNFVGHLIGGKAGGAVGGLLGSVASDGIKHIKKVALAEKEKLTKDQIFQQADQIQKLKMAGSAITKGLKETSKEHRETLRDTTTSWIAENVAGVLGNDIITSVAGEYTNLGDTQRAKKKLTAVKRLLMRGKNNVTK